LALVQGLTQLVSIFDISDSMIWDPLRNDPRFQALIEKYAANH
jgi:hypothetical protein